MEVLLLLVMGITNVACFAIGAKVGQKVVKGEVIELPTVNPMEAARRREAKKEEELEKNKIETILQNIDNYDGTGYGQKDVPWG